MLESRICTNSEAHTQNFHPHQILLRQFPLTPPHRLILVFAPREVELILLGVLLHFAVFT